MKKIIAAFDGLKYAESIKAMCCLNALFHDDRIVVIRAAHAIEKITLQPPEYLTKY